MPFRGTIITIGVFCFVHIQSSVAQHNFRNTKTVDPSGHADWSTITSAISDIDANPSVKWTVFIYAGTYTEEVILDDTKENVDLVGVDRDSVIIQAPANKDAVTIKGTGARNNSIRNLTIITNDSSQNEGRGIVITRPGPSGTLNNVVIDDVRIQTRGDYSDGINVKYLTGGLTISNCVIETQAKYSHAIHLDSWTGTEFIDDLKILNSQLIPSGGNSAVQPGSDSDGVRIEHKVKNLLVQNVHMRFDGTGLAVNFLSGGSGSKFITCDSMTVRSTKARPLIDLSGTTAARLVHCDLLDADAPYNFVTVGTDTQIIDSSIVVDRNSVDSPFAEYDSAGVYGNGISGLRIANSRIIGLGWGIRLDNNCRDVQVSHSTLTGTHFGVFLECGDGISFNHCMITADSAGNNPAINPPDYHGVFIGNKDSAPTCEPGAIRFSNCTIAATSNYDNLDARGVYIRAAPSSASGPVVFRDCNISARVTVVDADDGHEARAYGVIADETGSAALDGGSIVTRDADEREDIQYDVYNNSPGIAIATTGVRYTKWKGPVGAAVQPDAVTQRIIGVSVVSDTAILPATGLTTSEQTIATGITQPDVYRVLSVKGNQAGMTQKVYIIGRNWGNERITDVLTLNGTTPVYGAKAFRSVDKIILPAQSASGQTVAVGNSSKLGLYQPVNASADVLQQGRKAAAATSYTLETVGTVDATNATIDVGVAVPIAPGDSFEFVFLASR